MATESVSHSLAPVCLIECKNGQLSINKSALETLHKISQPVVVVAIAGLCHEGKAYLMNLLARENIGLLLGSTVHFKTKGIWMWDMSHSFKPNHRLILLGVEGLGDVDQSESKSDSWLFALAVLLSSVLVYSSVGPIDDEVLEKLHYVGELVQLIRVTSSPSPDGVGDASEFVNFFPGLTWTLLDCTLEPETAGRPFTEDEYLKKALKLSAGDSSKAENSNLIRECIRRFFPKQKCFVFDPPKYPEELLAYIENELENPLDSKLQGQLENFCSYIFTHARTKTLREGIEVTGNWLGTLVEIYVDAINRGAVLCLETAAATLAKQQNTAAMKKAADHFMDRVFQPRRNCTNTLQNMLENHTACEREAIAVFMENSFKDEDQEFQKKLLDITLDTKVNFLLVKQQPSYAYCEDKLDAFSKALKKGVSKGTFAVPGGYKLYKELREKIERDYWQVCEKGMQARSVFQSFLNLQVKKEKAILQADTTLSDEETAVAVEQAMMEAMEKEQELERLRGQAYRLWVEAQERSFHENMEQLKKKLEAERELCLREISSVLEHKLQLQKEFLDEGFEKKSEEMNAEIQHLKNKMHTIKNDRNKQTLDKFGKELSLRLSLP